VQLFREFALCGRRLPIELLAFEKECGLQRKQVLNACFNDGETASVAA
jgi:hypothetical protein